MRRARPVNLAASVRQRLLDLSRERGEDFNLVLTRYGVERILYRLARSPHAAQFVLKGAMLFMLWTGRLYRPTKDLDLLGYGDDSAEGLRKVFREVCAIEVEPDGLRFDPATIRITEIREDQEYQGLRVQLRGLLGKARVDVQVDVGFGDAVSPAPDEVTYPTLLGFPAPVLRAYPREAVVAEKFQAIVMLGIANSRMKDFFDLWMLGQDFAFIGKRLCDAIQATFERRRTPLPKEFPVALTPEFHDDASKQAQWRAFLARGGLEADARPLPDVALFLRDFLMLPATAVANKAPFENAWPPGGPWLPIGSGARA